MKKPTLPSTPRAQRSRQVVDQPGSCSKGLRKRSRRNNGENSDVLISAVISTYLLTHLHHVLQRAEYAAVNEGRASQAANFAQLRKVLCMDARSMKDASATGLQDGDTEKLHDPSIRSKVA